MTTRNPTTLMTIPSDETFDFLFKIVLIGDCGTGKTCVVQRFKNGTFIERHGNTIGVDFSMKTVMVDGKKVKVRSPTVKIISPCHQIYFSCKFGTPPAKNVSERSPKAIIGPQMA